MKAKIFYLLITIQIAVITFLIIQLYKNQRVNPISITPLQKDSIELKNTGDLKYFYEPKPNQEKASQVEGVEINAKHTFNKDGLNERFDYLLEKEKGIFRIITMGDSFTQGVGVDTKDNYSEQLEDLLNNSLKCSNISKFEVINLGVSGYDIPYAAKRFEIRGVKYDPDTVIWLITQNDLYEIREVMNPLAAKFKEQMQKSGEYQKEAEKGNFAPDWLAAANEMNKKYSENDRLGIYKKSIENLNIHFKKDLVLVTGAYIDKKLKKFIEESAADYTPEAKTLFFDTLPSDHYLSDGHFSKVGNQAMAKKLMDTLSEKKIINCE